MTGIRLEPWGADDLPLLRKTLGDPEMTKHLGGPESEEKLVERQRRLERLADSGAGHMFKIVDEATGEPVGSVGYWRRDWHGEEIFEIGWMVTPEFQGRGIAAAATAKAIEHAREAGGRNSIHAFPSVENEPSNAICKKLGFELLEEVEFEYPPGSMMRCNDWRHDLS
jgi:RimJ/RimL family protein N-acetyltransferase